MASIYRTYASQRWYGITYFTNSFHSIFYLHKMSIGTKYRNGTIVTGHDDEIESRKVKNPQGRRQKGRKR